MTQFSFLLSHLRPTGGDSSCLPGEDRVRQLGQDHLPAAAPLLEAQQTVLQSMISNAIYDSILFPIVSSQTNWRRFVVSPWRGSCATTRTRSPPCSRSSSGSPANCTPINDQQRNI